MNSFLLLISFFFLISAHAAGLPCYPASQMKYNYKMKSVSVKSKFCVDSKANFIINKNCSKTSACQAMKRRDIPLAVLHTKPDIGSPGHRICQIVKAVPIIVKYKTTGDWKETSICLFPDDSFINIDYMMKYNINPT